MKIRTASIRKQTFYWPHPQHYGNPTCHEERQTEGYMGEISYMPGNKIVTANK